MLVIDGAIRRHFVKNDLAITWFMAVGRLPLILILLLFIGFQLPPSTAMLFMLLGGIFWTLPFLLYYKAIAFEEPSRIALFIQTIPIFTLLIAYFLIQETLTGKQGIAFLFIIIGGMIAALKKLKTKWHISFAFILILIANITWATSDVLFKKFEPAFNSFLHAFTFFMLGGALVGIIISLFPKGHKAIKQHLSNLPTRGWVYMIISLVGGIAGSLTFGYALTLGKASLTTVIIGTQPLFAFGFGIILAPFLPEVYKEDISKNSLLLKGLSFSMIIIGLIYLQI